MPFDNFSSFQKLFCLHMILSDLNHDRPSVKKTIKCHHESGGSVLESIFTNPTILKCVNPGKSQAVCLFASPTLRNCKVIYLGTKHWCSFLCDLVQPSKVFQRDYLYTVLKMNRSPQGARRNDKTPLYPFFLSFFDIFISWLIFLSNLLL